MNTKMLPTPSSTRRGKTKMSEKMDNMQQGGCNKTIFSIRAWQTRDKTDTKHEANSRADRPQENEGIPPLVQRKG